LSVGLNSAEGVVGSELSMIAIAVSAIEFLRDLSEKREMMSFSSPSVVRSS